MFSQIRDLWVTPEIDLFATRVNRQLDMFASWKPDPEATFIDAFTIDWSIHKFYCFPPLPLISRCLRKVETDHAEGILIAPIWPTQVWWPQMLRLLITHPVALPQQRNLLKLPNANKVHPLNAKNGADGLLHIRRSYEAKGISESACNLLMPSWTPGTKKQYQVYIQKWSHFCAERQINHY